MNFTLPSLGKDINEVVIALWYAKESDIVKKDQDLLEVTTDKATFNVPSPCSGVISEIKAFQGDTVKPGDLLAILKVD